MWRRCTRRRANNKWSKLSGLMAEGSLLEVHFCWNWRSVEWKATQTFHKLYKRMWYPRMGIQYLWDTGTPYWSKLKYQFVLGRSDPDVRVPEKYCTYEDKAITSYNLKTGVFIKFKMSFSIKIHRASSKPVMQLSYNLQPRVRKTQTDNTKQSTKVLWCNGWHSGFCFL